MPDAVELRAVLDEHGDVLLDVRGLPTYEPVPVSADDDDESDDE